MPIFLAAVIGYVRFVIGQGRNLFWVKGSLSYSVIYEKRKTLNKKRELRYQFTRLFDFCCVRDPLPDDSWMVGENKLEGRNDPLAIGLSRLVGGRASHFVSRPQ